MQQGPRVVTLSPSSRRARGVQHHAARGVGLGLAVGQHGLDELELGDGLAELLALDGVARLSRDQPLGHADADGGDVEAAAVQHLHGGLEALRPRLPPISWRAGTRQFSKMTSQVWAPRWPIFLSVLPSVMPGVPASTMKAEMPPAPLLLRIGARHDREDAGLRRVGDEALGAVEDVVVAVAHRRVVRSEAASEPASGSVSANERDDLAGRPAAAGTSASAPPCRR